MVLGSIGPGRVGRRRFRTKIELPNWAALFGFGCRISNTSSCERSTDAGLRRASLTAMSLKTRAARARYRKRYAHQREEMAEFELHDAIFVHIPKTGGVSVSKALFGTGTIGGHRPARSYELIYGPRRYAEMFSFGFVREPVDRIHSAFSYLKSGGRGHRSDLEVAERLADIPSLETFVNEALGHPHYAHIAHFRPQSDFLCDQQGRVMVDFVGRFERLVTDFDAVAKRLGVDRTLEINLNVGPSTEREVLSDRALRRLSDYYAKDFANFNYPAPTD